MALAKCPVAATASFREEIFKLLPSLFVLDGKDKDGKEAFEDDEEGYSGEDFGENLEADGNVEVEDDDGEEESGEEAEKKRRATGKAAKAKTAEKKAGKPAGEAEEGSEGAGSDLETGIESRIYNCAKKVWWRARRRSSRRSRAILRRDERM